MEWVSIGKITKPHGLKGELKLHPFITDDSLLQGLRHGRLEDNGGTMECAILSIRGRHKRLILKLEDCNSIEQAQTFAKKTLLVPQADFAALPEGEYYWFQIIGLNVYDEEDRFYGNIAEIIQTGSNDVYVVRDDARELLLPMIDEVVKHIDLANKKLTFHKVEGLVEDHPV